MFEKYRNTNNTSLKFLLILTGMLISIPAQAQFIGISIDGAIAYSAAKKSVSGGALEITHPFPIVPNFGTSVVSFEETDPELLSGSNTLNLSTKVNITTYNFFYNVPFPVVSMSIGLGAGTMTTTATVTESDGTNTISAESEVKTPVTEAFIHIGLPFWSMVEFHIGYHSMSTSKLDVTQKSGITVSSYGVEEKNYTGGMTTVGLQFAF